MHRAAWIGIVFALALVPACSIGKRSLPVDPPPLADLEEPLDLREEPRDETERRELPVGSFTGLVVGAASDSLDALADESGGLVVSGVVENSPADLAGVATGDLVVEVRAGGNTTSPRWPSAWREVEIAAAPGSTLEIVLDRAGVERTVSITTVARARPAAREDSERFREDARVGVVLRTATEVEARAADLGPGGGAVVVGLSAASPWRTAGVRYMDLVRSIAGEPVAHPQVVLDEIRKAPEDGRLELVIVREGRTIELSPAVSKRAGELREIDIPLLYSYTSDRGRTETSILFGLYLHESTRAAWRTRILWFLDFSGGDADRLEEEPVPEVQREGQGQEDDGS